MATDNPSKTVPELATNSSVADILRRTNSPAPAPADEGTGRYPANSVARYTDSTGLDEFDHQMQRHRAELEAIDNQIANLDETIDLEQRKLRETKTALESRYHARARLLHLRSAMLHFVQELQAQEVE